MSKIDEVKEILTEDLIIYNITHENAPPHKDCYEDCGVFKNLAGEPLGVQGGKRRKCMDCWEEYVDKLANQICQLFEPEPSEITALPLDALPDAHGLEGYSMTATLSNESLLLSDELNIDTLKSKFMHLERVPREVTESPCWDIGGLLYFVITKCEAQLAKDMEHEQARVERIFREIDKYENTQHNITWVTIPHYDWQAIKKQEGIE